jgi:carotenoid cleavage dioxygenase
MNAYDTADGKVIIDICVYESLFNTDVLGPFEESKMPWLERWEIDPVRRTASTTVIDETGNEFPRIRGSLNGKPYRYGYSTGLNDGDSWPTLKHDLQTGERTQLDHGAGRFSGEPVFVPKAGSTGEDDGWLVTFIHEDTNPAEFVVMDAQDLGRGYVAQVKLPQRVPFGFHGNWVSDRSVSPD